MKRDDDARRRRRIARDAALRSSLRASTTTSPTGSSTARSGRCTTAKSLNDNVSVFDVPGCFELPLACQSLIETDRFDALVALGAVIRGQTPHFDFVAGECARGIMDVQLATSTPIGFGVLTTENLAQAQERADPQGGDKGYAAALAAATLLRMTSRDSAGRL